MFLELSLCLVAHERTAEQRVRDSAGDKTEDSKNRVDRGPQEPLTTTGKWTVMKGKTLQRLPAALRYLFIETTSSSWRNKEAACQGNTAGWILLLLLLSKVTNAEVDFLVKTVFSITLRSWKEAQRKVLKASGPPTCRLLLTYQPFMAWVTYLPTGTWHFAGSFGLFRSWVHSAY